MDEETDKLILGVDEAGRGPVIGPLVIVGYMIRESKIPELKLAGARDSKTLTPKQREQRVFKIQQLAEDYKVVIIEPKEIDAALETPGTNLNWLEADKTIKLINDLDPDAVILDCPSPNLKKYKAYILERLTNDKVELVVEHKAERHMPVAAASVIAKVKRDSIIEEIKKKYGNCGPGYPSNAITQEFIKKNWDKHPEIFRKSWATFKNHSQMKEQKQLGEY